MNSQPERRELTAGTGKMVERTSYMVSYIDKWEISVNDGMVPRAICIVEFYIAFMAICFDLYNISAHSGENDQ